MAVTVATKKAVIERDCSTLSNRYSIEWKRPRRVRKHSSRGLTQQIGTSDWRAEMDSTRLCSVEECDRYPNAGRGMCKKHWQRWRVETGPRCTVEGCEAGQRARGLCVMHWQRVAAHGTTDRVVRAPRTVEERLWPRVIPTGFCWEWGGAHDSNGYGVINLGHKNDRTHRVVYELLIGPIPDGLHLDHLCRNRGCCNPDHLEPVTPKENTLRGFAPDVVAARTNLCQRGHSLDDAYIRPDTGSRMCRPCMNGRSRSRASKAKSR